MSGIEVVGIVLGAIPLVIKGLEHYGEGVRTIKSMWNYPKEFATLSRRLRVENDLFRNTLELILCGCVEGKLMIQLLNEPGGKTWLSPKVELAMQNLLAGSYIVFLETISNMHEALESFIKRLRLGSDGKGPFNDPISFKEAYKRFKFSLRKSAYMDLIDTVRQDNSALERLTSQSSALVSSRARRVRPDTDVVRHFALSVFSSLQKSLRTSCTSPHIASLDVGALRPLPERLASAPSEVTSLRLVLQHTMGNSGSSSWFRKEAEIRLLPTPVSNTTLPTPNNTAKRGVRFSAPKPVAKTPTTQPAHDAMTEIQDLCEHVLTLQTQDCNVCLGFLKGVPSTQRHGLYRPFLPLMELDSLTTMTLGEILITQDDEQRLSVAKRRKLAASLALGMIRLHDTPWLAQQWGHREIIFFRKESSVLIEHPFVTTTLHHPQAEKNHSSEYFAQCPAIFNETLFALGIILIELCLHKPFEALLSSTELNADGTKHAASVYLAALRLVGKVDEEASRKYADAIRQCIRCPFDQKGTGLGDGAFYGAVYDEVFAVLQDEANQFY